MTSERRALLPVYLVLALLAGAVIFEGALIGWLFSKVVALESEVREKNAVVVQLSPTTAEEEDPTTAVEVAPRAGTYQQLCMLDTERLVIELLYK